MSRRVIISERVAKPKAPLSHAVAVNGLVFVSGMNPFTPDRKLPEGFEAQMHQLMKNLQTVLGDAGSDLDHVVKANVILADIADFDLMNRIYREYFREGNYPARMAVQSKMGVPGMLLEIECVAEVFK